MTVNHRLMRAAAAIQPWVPRLTARATGLVGAAELIRGAVPHVEFYRAAALLPAPMVGAARALEIAVGLCLLMLARGLSLRQRRAHAAVIAILAIGALPSLALGVHPGKTLTHLALAAVLLAYRAEFRATGDPTTRWRAAATFAGLSATSVALGLAMVELRARDVAGHRPVLSAALQQVLVGFVGADGPLVFRSARSADIVAFTLPTLAAITLLTSAWLLLRSYQPVPGPAADDDRRLRELLGQHGGRDSLGYFALRDDKSVVLSPSRKAAVAYRVVNGVMLAAGDPIGDPEAWPQAIDAFMTEAAHHGWVPAAVGCSERGASAWTRQAKLDALEIGDEAVVHTGAFSLEGRAMRNVRQMVNRIERNGYTTRVRRVAELTAEERAELATVASSWRGDATERGFSMALGRFADARDPEAVVVTAHREGQVRALLQFVPWGNDGLSLDLMRRDPSADPGLNELLIVATLRAAADLGVAHTSLNFAAFRSALARGEQIGAGPVAKAWAGTLVFASRWFQIESLYRFNAKFQPTWVPRYVVFPGTGSMARVSAAYLEAEAFLVRPKLLRR